MTSIRKPEPDGPQPECRIFLAAMRLLVQLFRSDIESSNLDAVFARERRDFPICLVLLVLRRKSFEAIEQKLRTIESDTACPDPFSSFVDLRKIDVYAKGNFPAVESLCLLVGYGNVVVIYLLELRGR